MHTRIRRRSIIIAVLALWLMTGQAIALGDGNFRVAVMRFQQETCTFCPDALPCEHLELNRLYPYGTPKSRTSDK